MCSSAYIAKTRIIGIRMKITKQNGPPEDLLYFDEEVNLTPGAS